jgi:hypothetical protein
MCAAYTIVMRNHLKEILIKLSNFFLKNHRGQIRKNTEIGRWILLLSSLSDINSIVEIGTWNGAGSSSLIARGVASNLAKIEKTKVYGLEIDGSLAKIARKNLKKYKFYSILHGSIINESDLDLEDLMGSEPEWVQKDRENVRSCPNVLAMLPDVIDLLILDGGEFSTYSEFKKLEDRISKFLILDDTVTRKSRKILEEVEASKDYQIIFKSNERNGTAVILKL